MLLWSNDCCFTPVRVLSIFKKPVGPEHDFETKNRSDGCTLERICRTVSTSFGSCVVYSMTLPSDCCLVGCCWLNVSILQPSPSAPRSRRSGLAISAQIRSLLAVRLSVRRTPADDDENTNTHADEWSDACARQRGCRCCPSLRLLTLLTLWQRSHGTRKQLHLNCESHSTALSGRPLLVPGIPLAAVLPALHATDRSKSARSFAHYEGRTPTMALGRQQRCTRISVAQICYANHGATTSTRGDRIARWAEELSRSATVWLSGGGRRAR